MTTINYLTTIQFDFGALRLVPDELQRLNIQRPLIVTDKGVRTAGLLARLEEAIGNSAKTFVYDETPANPTEDAVITATDVFRNEGCDGIIAIGGGSPIDLGKAVALLATHPAPLQQYAVIEGGLNKITSRIAPLIAIPTTAGTGSEVGRGSMIVMKSGSKLGLLSPHLLPKVAICDPELTLGLPPMLTAATGLDAIAHCIETFLSAAINPPADAIALDGLRRAVRNIERATFNGHDREARWNMMMAATEGAMTFQKGLGSVHALSHPLGALPKLQLHHGTLNAVLLPAVIRFNGPSVGGKLAALGDAMGIASSVDPAEAIRALNKRLGLPSGLGAMGVTRDVLGQIAQLATKDHCHATNPRKATGEDYVRILEESYSGEEIA